MQNTLLSVLNIRKLMDISRPIFVTDCMCLQVHIVTIVFYHDITS